MKKSFFSSIIKAFIIAFIIIVLFFIHDNIKILELTVSFYNQINKLFTNLTEDSNIQQKTSNDNLTKIHSDFLIGGNISTKSLPLVTSYKEIIIDGVIYKVLVEIQGAGTNNFMPSVYYDKSFIKFNDIEAGVLYDQILMKYIDFEITKDYRVIPIITFKELYSQSNIPQNKRLVLNAFDLDTIKSRIDSFLIYMDLTEQKIKSRMIQHNKKIILSFVEQIKVLEGFSDIANQFFLYIEDESVLLYTDEILLDLLSDVKKLKISNGTLFESLVLETLNKSMIYVKSDHKLDLDLDPFLISVKEELILPEKLITSYKNFLLSQKEVDEYIEYMYLLNKNKWYLMTDFINQCNYKKKLNSDLVFFKNPNCLVKKASPVFYILIVFCVLICYILLWGISLNKYAFMFTPIFLLGVFIFTVYFVFSVYISPFLLLGAVLAVNILWEYL